MRRVLHVRLNVLHMLRLGVVELLLGCGAPSPTHADEPYGDDAGNEHYACADADADADGCGCIR